MTVNAPSGKAVFIWNSRVSASSYIFRIQKEIPR